MLRCSACKATSSLNRHCTAPIVNIGSPHFPDGAPLPPLPESHSPPGQQRQLSSLDSAPHHLRRLGSDVKRLGPRAYPRPRASLLVRRTKWKLGQRSCGKAKKFPYCLSNLKHNYHASTAFRGYATSQTPGTLGSQTVYWRQQDAPAKRWATKHKRFEPPALALNSRTHSEGSRSVYGLGSKAAASRLLISRARGINM